VYPLGGARGLAWLKDVMASSTARTVTAARGPVSVTLRR
jgi:hypothetical protein